MKKMDRFVICEWSNSSASLVCSQTPEVLKSNVREVPYRIRLNSPPIYLSSTFIFFHLHLLAALICFHEIGSKHIASLVRLICFKFRNSRNEMTQVSCLILIIVCLIISVACNPILLPSSPPLVNASSQTTVV